MSLGSRLRSARLKKGWTQSYVCKKLGIPNSTLSGYERDFRSPDPDTIRKLADLYEVSTDYLFGLDKPSIEEKVRDTLDKINNAIDPNLDRKYADVFLKTLEEIFYMSQQPDFPKKQEEVFQRVLEIIRGMMVEGKKIPDPILDILLVSLETAKQQMIKENNNPSQSEG